jgi:hypothetical protein
MLSSTSSNDQAQARVGTLLADRWHLDSLLAVGGCSAIYAATHRNGHRIAVKILHPELSRDATAVQHFLREGYAANRIGHQGVVAVTDEGTTADGVPFLLMPLLDGETAQQRLERKPDGLPNREALAIVEAVLDVLASAHARGIVHRDLKPENVFLERTGGVRILDFGIARIVDGVTPDGTVEGTVMGTPGFMPPEQACGRLHEVGPRSDIWAAGALLFTLMTGRSLHEASSVIESIAAAQTDRVPPAAQLVPGIAPAAARLLDGALAFEPERRYADAGAMRAAVRAAIDEARAIEQFGSCPGVTVDALAAGAPPSIRVAPRSGLGIRGAMMIAASTMFVAGIAAAGIVHMRASDASHAVGAGASVKHAEAPTVAVTVTPPPPPVVDINDLPRAPGAAASAQRRSGGGGSGSGSGPHSGEIVRKPGF